MTNRRRARQWIAVAVIAVLASLPMGCTASTATGERAPDASAPTSSNVPPTTAPTPVVTKTPSGIDYAAMKRDLRKRLADGPESLRDVRSVLVSVDGTTKLAYYQDSKPTDHAHVWSVTKSVLSILVGIAIDEGRLRLDQRLAELLPEHVASMTPEQQQITLRQLLTMTGGMPGDDGGLNAEAEDPVGQILAYATVGQTDAFLYSNTSAHLVTSALHQAIDRPILDYAREKLFDPLGIDTRPAWQGANRFQKNGFDEAGFAWQTDAAGTNMGPYGLRLTPEDMVKLGELYLNGGTWHGHRIVSADWVTASTSKQLTDEHAASDGQYGYLWWIIDDPEIAGFAAAGSWCQHIDVYPSRRTVVVITADDAEYSESEVCNDIAQILVDVVLDPLLR